MCMTFGQESPITGEIDRLRSELSEERARREAAERELAAVETPGPALADRREELGRIACQAMIDTWACGKSIGWDAMNEEWRERYCRIADAVLAAVGPTVMSDEGLAISLSLALDEAGLLRPGEYDGDALDVIASVLSRCRAAVEPARPAAIASPGESEAIP
jgi:hypothetical protein